MIRTHLPALSKPQATVLALWSLGRVLADQLAHQGQGRVVAARLAPPGIGPWGNLPPTFLHSNQRRPHAPLVDPPVVWWLATPLASDTLRIAVRDSPGA
jgi:hypothetical protein